MAERPISLDELDKFGVDQETMQLYWRGKEVILAASLPRWVQWWAIAAAAATVVQAVAAVYPIVQPLWK